jgi:hypothetical protein
VCQAADFTCPAGDVLCLIKAINAANSNGETNTITLAAGTYPLKEVHNNTDGPNGLPSITSPLSLTIQGAGAESTSIERDTSAPGFRLFHVAATGVLSLYGLSVRGGELRQVDFLSRPAFGGCIWNQGTLLLQHTMLTSNNVTMEPNVGSSAAGGGLYNADGQVMLIDSTVTGNHTTGAFGSDGGGLFNIGGTMNLTRSTLMDNTVDGYPGGDGGGLSNYQGTVTLTDCVLTGNTAIGGRSAAGGGIFNLGTLTITNTILTNNTVDTANSGGGGVWSNGMLIITQSTFTSNHANNGQGGGLLNYGTARISTSTFANNTAYSGGTSRGGGGLRISGTGSLTNTTVVHNSVTDFTGFDNKVQGGGLEVAGVVSLTNCTIAENVTDSIASESRTQGGGLYAAVAQGISQTRSLPALGAQARWKGRIVWAR